MPTDSSITTRSCDDDGLLSNLTDNDEDDDALIILSGDSKKPALKITIDCLENDELGTVLLLLSPRLTLILIPHLH
jgi:hypothetical protein